MLAKLRPRSVYDVMGALACFGVLFGGTAYAANEWNSSNIQNETLLGADVRGTNGTSTTKGTNGSLTGADISGQPAIPASGQPFVNGSLGTYDIANGSLNGDDLAANSVRADEVADGQVRSLEIGNGQVQAEDLAPGVAPGASGARAWALVGNAGDVCFARRTSPRSPFPGGRGGGQFHVSIPGSGIDPDTAVMVVGEDNSYKSTPARVSTPYPTSSGRAEAEGAARPRRCRSPPSSA